MTRPIEIWIEMFFGVLINDEDIRCLGVLSDSWESRRFSQQLRFVVTEGGSNSIVMYKTSFFELQNMSVIYLPSG